jgi:hypothetical protein
LLAKSLSQEYFPDSCYLPKKSCPFTNRKIEIYQSGGNTIIMGSSVTFSNAVTVANGRFTITFTSGKSYFPGFSGANSSPLKLSCSEGFPFFRI